MTTGARRGIVVALTIVLLAGAVIGYAHWHLRQLQDGGASWATEVDLDGGIAVSGPNAFVLDEPDGLTVVRVDDGQVLHRLGGRDPEPHTLWLGTDGSFVVRGSALDEQVRYAAYDADGEQLWTRDLDGLHRVTAIGPQGVTLSACEGSKCRTVTYDTSGEELWSLRPDADDDWGSGPYWRQFQDQASALRVADAVTTVPSTPTIHRDGRLHTVDPDGRVSELSVPLEHSVMVGDTMLHVTADADGCHARGVREDAEAWDTTIDCGGRLLDGFPRHIVLTERLYVALEDGAMLSLDPTTGEGVTLATSFSGFDPETTEATIVGDRVVLEQEGASVRALDAGDGAELWERGFDASTGSQGTTRYPGVRSSAGAVDVGTRFGGVLRALAVGADAPSSLATVLDARTGRTRAELADDDIWSVRGLPDGTALVLHGGVLSRIGTD